MTPLAELGENPFLVIGGWTLLLVIWESAVLAVLLEGWRALRPGAPARTQYASAASALGLTLLFAAATPVVIARVPSSAAPASTTAKSEAAALTADRPAPIAHAVEAPYEIAGISANAIVGWVGIAWVAGVVLLALKLLGGWLVALRVRRRAVPVVGPVAALAAVERLRTQLHVSAPIELLQSHEVEAPVVIGWRHPALILPDDVANQLSLEMIEPLLIHEFAHIARHDYVANLLQAFADLLLFFSPAAAWISKRIREAREYCCDDFVVFTCRDSKRYVSALTTLAALGTLHRTRPSLGAAGPRLIVRVRRLLQEESMTKFSSTRVAILMAAFLGLIITGARLGVVSVAHASAAVRSAFVAGQNSVPFGYTTEQPGSAAVLTRVVSSPEYPAELVTVRNMATQTISGIAFAAIVEFLPRAPVRIFTSELRPVSIAPGQTADIAPNVLSAEQLQKEAGQYNGRVQVFFGLTKIRYANGFEWSVTPNPAAMSGRDALSLPRPDLPRSLVVVARTEPTANESLCHDEQRKEYSPGMMMGIRAEPGNFARCIGGQWVEVDRNGRPIVKSR